MKKRVISLLLALVLALGLLPTAAWAAGTISDYFSDMPITAETEPGYPNSRNKWKVSTLNGETVLVSGNNGKSNSSSTLQLTMKDTVNLSFEYKVSTEKDYDKLTISHGSTNLVNEVSGLIEWIRLNIDAKQGDVISIVYKKDSSGNKNDDCVYLRNFTCGTPIVVTLHANNGTDVTSTQNIYGGKGTLKANKFTNPGKVFVGWAKTADGKIKYFDGATIENVTSDFDLYAVWGDAYTVTFDYNDGKTGNATVDVAQITAIGTVKMPKDPTKKGYTFEGWFHGEDKLTTETTITSDVTYTAKWTPIQYTIVLNPGKGVGKNVTLDAVVYDQYVTLPKNTFTCDGYDFNGWGTSASASYGPIEDGAAVKNLTDKGGATYNLYATWKGKEVKVTVNPNYEGAAITSRTGAVGSNYNYIFKTDGGPQYFKLESPVRTGYIFDGWFDAAEGGNEITNQYKFTAEDAGNDKTLYAHWTKGITVHFDGNGYRSTFNDKTVTPDKVFSNLPHLSSFYYPANKTLDGWYIKNSDGSFGEAVNKDTVFDGDEVTLIAKWRDYQYVIKFNIKYADKSSVTGTMADQPAPFGKDVKLSKCAFTREGYDFAGWTESYGGSTATYNDEATINREWSDDYWDGSEDGEIYKLYAVWTENKSPAQTEAEAKLAAAERAISGTYNCTYGTDTNALTMVQAKLTAANITDVSVSVKEEYNSNYVGISADGELRYKWNDNGSTTAAAGSIRPILVLTYNKTYTKESKECLFSMGLDEKKAAAALNAVAERVGASLPSTIEKTEDLTALPKYPLKAGVNADGVDYNSSADLESWTTAIWEEKSGKLTIKSVEYPFFSPYKVTVTQDKEKDVLLTLTLTLVYNGREDLKVTRDFPINIKRGDAGGIDYQAALEGALSDPGLRDFVTGKKLTANENGVYTTVNDIQFPTTRDLKIDGKYTPVVITSSDTAVIETPDVANAARVNIYRPLPGEAAKTVTLTVKILDRPSGSGRDYANLPVLAEKRVTVSVQPLTQAEIDAEIALMAKVKAAYWDGICNGNPDWNNVTTDLHAFQECYLGTDGQLTWVYDRKDLKNHGIVPVPLDNWYDLQLWRLFRSSNADVIAHENLLVSRREESKAVTVTSYLSSETLGKYAEKYPQNADFQKLYKQPVTIDLVVTGTQYAQGVGNTVRMQAAKRALAVRPTVSVSFALSGRGMGFAKDALSYAEGSTVYDVFSDMLAKHHYTCKRRGSYIASITSDGGVTLEEFDEGKNSGWMYRVNGVLVRRYMSAQGLKDGDRIELYFTSDWTSEPGAGSWKPVTPVTKGETPTGANGSATKVETKPDGTVVETTTKLDGTTVETTTKPDGSFSAVEKRADGTTVETSAPAGGGITASVSVPKKVGSTRVDLPVSAPTGGMVAVLVHPDGTEEILKNSVVTDTGIAFRAEGTMQVRITDNAKHFEDTQKHWAKEAVEFASARELFNGVSGSEFAPDLPMTRGMVNTVLARLAGADTMGGASWYAKGTAWAVENGISDGTNPEQEVTREQLAAMLYRYADSPAVSGALRFDDAGAVSDWAYAAVKWCAENGIMNGVGSNLAAPQGLAHRGQVAAMLMRFLRATL